MEYGTKDEKGNYNGPRGKQLLEVFICHGCQSCLRMNAAGDIVDTGPHVISKVEVVTNQYEKKVDA